MTSLLCRERILRGKNESREMSQEAGYNPVLVRKHRGSDQVVADPTVTQITGEKWMSSEKTEEEYTEISGKLNVVRERN